MSRPYASDWEAAGVDLQYSKELGLYWHRGRVYDERSARHNGLIGVGARLKAILADENQPAKRTEQ